MDNRQADALPENFQDSGCEDIDEALREVDELVKSGNNGFSIKNLAFAERYLESEAELGFVIDVSATLECQQFVAMFKRKLTRKRRSDTPAGTQLGAPREIGAHSSVAMSSRDRNQQLVFVGDVDTVQTPEGIVPSWIRLEPINEFYRRCGRAINSMDGACTKVVDIRTYWECCVVIGDSTAVSDEFDSEEIKSRAEVMNAITDEGTPFDWNSLAFTKAVNFVTGLRVLINDKAVRPTAFKSQDGCVKIIKVLFGPLYLYANATKVNHGNKDRSNEEPRVSKGGATFPDYAPEAT